MTRPKVGVLGDVMTDVVVGGAALATAGDDLVVRLARGSDLPSEVALLAGGSAANTAAWLAHDGQPTELLARIGTDLADWHTHQLHTAGVTFHPELSAEPTGATVTFVDSVGERSFLTSPGANLGAFPTARVEEFLDSIGWLHASAYCLMREPAPGPGAQTPLDIWQVAGERGIPRSVDLASAAPMVAFGAARLRERLAGAAVVLANLDEARCLADLANLANRRGELPKAQEVAHELAAMLGAEVVVKLGADGAIAASGDVSVQVPAIPTVLVDSVGAGDAFAAGYLAARLGGKSLQACLTRGSRLAAAALAIRGGRPQV